MLKIHVESNMHINLLLLIFTMVAIPNSSFAYEEVAYIQEPVFETSASLQQRLTKIPVKPATTYIEGYVLGVVDSHVSTICLPDKLDRKELLSVASNFLKNIPEEKQYTAPSILIAAFREKWPCPGEK